jgi:hypothetical protein
MRSHATHSFVSMKRSLILCVLIVLCGPWARSQGLFESSLLGGSEEEAIKNFDFGGFVRSALYLGQTPLEEDFYLQSAYAQAGMLLKGKAGSLATAKADIRFRAGTEWQEEFSSMEIREAYVDLQTGPVGFKFGKLISPWGKGTVFNPVDKMTPLDPTVNSPEPDDRYLGIWALQGRVNLGQSLKLTATWNPLYQSGKLLIDPVPFPDYVRFLEPDYPGPELKEGSYGFRMDLHSRVMDASVYGFHGYHRWPGIAYGAFAMDTVTMEPLALELFEKAYRIQMAGADLSVPLGPWIIRAEGAWSAPTESRGNNEYLPFAELSYAAEAEVGTSWLTLVGGYLGKYILDYTPPVSEPSLAAGPEQFAPLFQSGVPVTGALVNEAVKSQIGAFNRLYNYQLEELYHTAFLVTRGSFFYDQLEFELPVIWHITTQEWIVQPSVSWMPADGIKLKAGYQGYFGPSGGLLDLVGPTLNAGYLALTYMF